VESDSLESTTTTTTTDADTTGTKRGGGYIGAG
jgi:hypothetical protein